MGLQELGLGGLELVLTTQQYK